MPRFSRNQALLAKALVEKPKTVKELRDELGLSLNEIENDLAKLIKLKLVEKLGGYPTNYRAIEQVRRGVMENKPNEEHFFRAHAIIEGQSVEKKALENATKHMIKQMENDHIVTVANIREDETINEDGVFKNLLEVDVAAKRFEDLIYFVLNYGPSSIELEPFNEYVLKTDEAQGVVMDMASFIQTYATLLVQKDIALQEHRKKIAEYRKKSPEIFIN